MHSKKALASGGGGKEVGEGGGACVFSLPFPHHPQFEMKYIDKSRFKSCSSE